MITLNKTLDNGVVITKGKIVNFNVSKGNKLSASLCVYVDSAHMTANKPVKSYSINQVIDASTPVSSLEVLSETLAIAKYDDLTGAVQS